MAWPPTTSLTDANILDDTKDPKLARADFVTMFDKQKLCIDAKDIASGVAGLDSNGKVLAAQLNTSGLADINTSNIYVGKINPAGTVITGGAGGWTVAKSGADLYTVTHTLGTANYHVLVFGQVAAAIPTHCNLVSRTTTTFTFEQYKLDETKVAINDSFYMLVKY